MLINNNNKANNRDKHPLTNLDNLAQSSLSNNKMYKKSKKIDKVLPIYL